MLVPDDPFAPLFKRTFGANYHPEIFQDEDEVQHLVPQEAPTTFYDRHIASHLSLQHVVYEPSLVPSLSRTCELAIQRYLDGGHRFCEQGYNFSLAPDHGFFHDAHSTAMYYSRFAAYLCPAYAYKLVMHPKQGSWKSPFVFLEGQGEGEYLFTTELWLAITRRLDNLSELLGGMTKALEEKIRRLARKYPRLATWHMFAMTDTVTKMFQSLTESTPFSWESCRTLGCKTTATSNFPLDARTSIPIKELRRLKPRARSPSRKGTTVTTRKFVTVPEPPSKVKQKLYRPDFRHYVQHAWARAAVDDSTYIIFQCGRYERIGLRHRSSQTLYLSGIIDPINIKNPPYRKLQIGLHTAIVQDALERLELSDPELKTGRKRRAEDADEAVAPPRKMLKKAKTTTTKTITAAAKLYDEIAERDLALLILDYGAFCSPAPSSFLRIGPSCVPGHAVPKRYPTHRRFKKHEHFSLVLKEPLGQGAVGVAHPAAVSLELESGEVLRRDMVIKLAFNNEQKEKMMHEYRIYGHLSFKKNLESIVTVHGMFQDPESKALGMLMDDAGQSLRRREMDRGGDGIQVTTTPAEREAFRRVLQKLHEAGVRHHDIRADNLLINSRNEVFIIDLDRADFEVSEENKEHEMNCLNDLLEGRYRDGLYYS